MSSSLVCDHDALASHWTEYLSGERRKLMFIHSTNNFIKYCPVPSVGLSMENSKGNEMWPLLPNSSIHVDISLGLCVYHVVNRKSHQQ